MSAGSALEQRLRTAIDGTLRTLLEKDGGGLEFVSLEDHRCTIRLGGRFRGCPGTPLVVDEVIVPLLSRAAGQEIEVVVRAF